MGDFLNHLSVQIFLQKRTEKKKFFTKFYYKYGCKFTDYQSSIYNTSLKMYFYSYFVKNGEEHV